MNAARKSAAAPDAAEKIVIGEGMAELQLPGASRMNLPLPEVIEQIRQLGVRGLGEEALPHNTRWKVECGPLTVFIVELEPEVRSLLWIRPGSPAPYGPLAAYERYRLATPYVILKVPFRNGRILPACELFFRNRPLHGLDDELYWPNLLNVSPEANGCTAWFCTQYLGGELVKRAARNRKPPGMTDQLDVLVKHLWGGGFNLSSEAHEGASCFLKAVRDGVDPRVTDVARWQQETEKNHHFILEVPWKPAGLTVRGLIVRQLETAGVLRDLGNAAELVSVLLGIHGSKKGG